MKVVVPYTELHPLCEQSVKRYAPRARFVDVSGDGMGYKELMRKLWAEGESFLVVEHDVEIHADVLPELRKCPHPWCMFGYQGAPNGEGQTSYIERALGCTRFSGDLLRVRPNLMDNIHGGHWKSLDSLMVAPLMEVTGGDIHLHKPPVTHHHRYYPRPRCSCGEVVCPP